MLIIDVFSIFICITIFEYKNIYIYMPVNTVYIYIYNMYMAFASKHQ